MGSIRGQCIAQLIWGLLKSVLKASGKPCKALEGLGNSWEPLEAYGQVCKPLDGLGKFRSALGKPLEDVVRLLDLLWPLGMSCKGLDDLGSSSSDAFESLWKVELFANLWKPWEAPGRPWKPLEAFRRRRKLLETLRITDSRGSPGKALGPLRGHWKPLGDSGRLRRVTRPWETLRSPWMPLEALGSALGSPWPPDTRTAGGPSAP